MNKFLAAALIAAPMLASAGTVSNLVQNGSFENKQVSNWDVLYGNTLPGWNAESAGIELRHNVEGSAQQGLQFVELDTYTNSGISQTIDTAVGQKYDFSFFYADRINQAAATNGLDWKLGNGSWQSIAGGNGLGDHQWNQVNSSFIATDLTTTISFRATGNSDSLGTSLDNVTLTAAVPEPQTYALMLAGLGAMVLLSRRRQINK